MVAIKGCAAAGKARYSYPVISRDVLAAIMSAVRASTAEALAVSGLPADTWIDMCSILAAARIVLGERPNAAAIKRTVDALAYVAVERHLDAVTAPAQQTLVFDAA
jgi:hypothetical protein